MTALTAMHRLLLQVVGESRGEWDTRNIDYAFHSRSGSLDRSLLAELRDLEAAGLVAEVHLEGGTGPGWRLTGAGEEVLA